MSIEHHSSETLLLYYTDSYCVINSVVAFPDYLGLWWNSNLPLIPYSFLILFQKPIYIIISYTMVNTSG